MVTEYHLGKLENAVYLLMKTLLVTEFLLFVLLRVFYTSSFSEQIVETMVDISRLGLVTPLFFCPRAFLIVSKLFEKAYKSFVGKMALGIAGGITVALSFCYANQFVNHVTHQNPAYFSAVVNLCASIIIILIWMIFLPAAAYFFSITVGTIQSFSSNMSLSSSKIENKTKGQNKQPIYFGLGALGWVYILFFLSDVTKVIPHYILEEPIVYFGYYNFSQCKNVSETEKMAFLDGDHISVVKYDDFYKKYIFTDSVCEKANSDIKV